MQSDVLCLVLVPLVHNVKELLLSQHKSTTVFVKTYQPISIELLYTPLRPVCTFILTSYTLLSRINNNILWDIMYESVNELSITLV